MSRYGELVNIFKIRVIVRIKPVAKQPVYIMIAEFAGRKADAVNHQ